MIETELTRAIRERLETIVENLRLKSDKKDQPDRPPTVVNGYLAPKRSNQQSDFPYLIVRPGQGTTGSDGFTRVTVKLLVGCFSEEFDGFEYGLQVLSLIRKGLMESPTLEKRYRMELPFDWELFDDQPYPEWVLEATTQWTIATPLEIPDEGVTGL
ncbi:MAG: hypothetical protein IBX55_13510 [Methyloprofundus sp.]|nr:hypothetical protein [Methyloprofundus sp.]